MYREDTYPLSPMQYGMLVHGLAAPHSGSTSNNSPFRATPLRPFLYSSF